MITTETLNILNGDAKKMSPETWLTPYRVDEVATNLSAAILEFNKDVKAGTLTNDEFHQYMDNALGFLLDNFASFETNFKFLRDFIVYEHNVNFELTKISNWSRFVKKYYRDIQEMD